jgi:hypothetical protein
MYTTVNGLFPGTVEANNMYESLKAGTSPPLSSSSGAPASGVRKSFSEGNIKLFARTTSVEMARGSELPTLAEEGTNGDSR